MTNPSDQVKVRYSPQFVTADMSNSSDTILIKTRDAVLGEHLQIRRALPSRDRRMIGAWCFLDQAGPADVSTQGLRVAPHPHIGLQTFTWMIEGEILHTDSLGYSQVTRPNQINLMTAGYGISHAETSPEQRSATVHAAQLWIALPDEQFEIAPAFEHYPDVPQLEQQGLRMQVLTGEWFGVHSPVQVYSPLAAVDVEANGATTASLPLRVDFEYGILPLAGHVQIDGQSITTGTLLYLPVGQQELVISTDAAARFLLIGGEPFQSERIIWWNFVGRNPQDIEQARLDWQHGTRFGQVAGFTERLDAPELVGNLKATR